MNNTTANEYCQSLILKLHHVQPSHPIFGPKKKGLIRAPVEHWCKKVGNLFVRDYRLGDNACWMRRDPVIQLTVQDNRQTVVCARVMVTRLLAFLVNPTDANWQKLGNRANATQTPFDHCCARGQPRPGQNDLVCCNGVQHGTFSTRNDNEDRKKCTNGCSALCPGHGASRSKCIFTHPDGSLAPCRNNDDHLPKCKCNIKCY